MRLFRVFTLCILGLFLIGPSILNLSDAHGENAPPQQPHSVHQNSQLTLIETFGRGSINEVAWSPDETIMAIASTNGLWLYDTQNYQETATVSEGLNVSAITFNHDGSQIAYLDGGGMVDTYRITVWDIFTQEAASTSDIDEYVTTFVFSQDNRQLIAATLYGYVIPSTEKGIVINRFEATSES